MAEPNNQQRSGADRLEDLETDSFSRALEKAKHGDSSGFAFVYGQYNRIVGSVVRSQGSPDPEQTVNAVFSKAFRSIDRFVGNESNFASYLYQIAHFQSIDDRRAHNRRVQLGDTEQQLVSDDTTNESDSDLSSTARRINEALQALTQEQREVVVLRVFFGLSGPDTAYALDKPIADVRSLQNRAEARLRVFVVSEAATL